MDKYYEELCKAAGIQVPPKTWHKNRHFEKNFSAEFNDCLDAKHQFVPEKLKEVAEWLKKAVGDLPPQCYTIHMYMFKACVYTFSVNLWKEY